MRKLALAAMSALVLAAASTAHGADGRTLILIAPTQSARQRTTRFAVLAARRLRVQKQIVLRGVFGFDAISPDGGTVYLTQYLSPTNPIRYAVRALDVASGKLVGKPLVDPREPDEKMQGNPITRAT